MSDVTNKVALVTGGARGIGLGMAQAFLDAGMKVAIADVSPAALQAATESLAIHGGNLAAVQLDVTLAGSWRDAVNAVWARFGTIDVLCNNAGVGQGRPVDKQPMTVTTIPETTWRMVIETNLTGVFLGVHEVAPRMIARSIRGHIVNTASMAGLIAPAELGAYAASKFGVVGLSEALRAELAPYGIGVSILCPGGVNSNLVASTAERQFADSNEPASPAMARAITRPATDFLMQARSVGQRVLEAIIANEFHIITHPEYEKLVQERLSTISAAFGRSAEPGYRDPEPLLVASRNPAYRPSARPPTADP